MVYTIIYRRQLLWILNHIIYQIFILLHIYNCKYHGTYYIVVANEIKNNDFGSLIKSATPYPLPPSVFDISISCYEVFDILKLDDKPIINLLR